MGLLSPSLISYSVVVSRCLDSRVPLFMHCIGSVCANKRHVMLVSFFTPQSNINVWNNKEPSNQGVRALHFSIYTYYVSDCTWPSRIIGMERALNRQLLIRQRGGRPRSSTAGTWRRQTGCRVLPLSQTKPARPCPRGRRSHRRGCRQTMPPFKQEFRS